MNKEKDDKVGVDEFGRYIIENTYIGARKIPYNSQGYYDRMNESLKKVKKDE